MRWTWTPVGLGFIVALVVLIAVVLLALLRQIDVPLALLIVAVCSHRL